MEQEYRAQEQARQLKNEEINRDSQRRRATRSNDTKPPTPPTWNNPTTKEDKAAYRADALAYLKKGQEYVKRQFPKIQYTSEFSKIRTLEEFEDAWEPIKDEIERLTV